MFDIARTSVLVGSLWTLISPQAYHRPRSVPTVELVALADGVHAAVRGDPLGLAVNSNSLVVVGEREVLVVDAQFTREATLQTIAAIRGVTSNPVRWVVNTHWHDDHVAGNQVYRDSFPDVQFLAHAHTREDFVALGRPNRAGTSRGAPPLVQRFQRLLDAGLGVDSTPVSAAERASVTSAMRIMRQYLAELPGFHEALEGPVVRDRLRIRVAPHDVELRWFGRANTRGDLVVFLPAAGVVAVGDLLVWPVPFAFGSHPTEWTAVLDSVAALRPGTLVPGHGPVMRDLGYLDAVRGMLGDLRREVTAARARGDSLPLALREITLATHRARVAGIDKWMTWMFENFFLRPAIRAAWQEP